MQYGALDRRDFLHLGVGIGAWTVAGCTAGLTARPRFAWQLQPPESAGISRDGLKGIRAAVQKLIDEDQHTGAVTAVVRRNKLVWYEAQGVRNVESGAAMRRDDIFRMMSSTKPVTAVAVLMMMDAGRLSIDDKVSRFIPSFRHPKVAIYPDGWQESILDPEKREDLVRRIEVVPAEREITIKDLLTHTSGLSSSYGMAPGPGSLLNQLDFTLETTLAERIPQLGDAVLDFQPGSRWGYSALDGFDTLLHIVELASGQQAHEFLRTRLFEPLDMWDTHFNVPPDKRDRLLTLYERTEDEWTVATPMFGDVETRYWSGAGGLMSTAHDFMQFELMLLNHGTLDGRRILRPETVDLMSTNHVGSLFAEWIPPITKGTGFGLGVRVVLDPDVVGDGRGEGAFGWGGAYGTESWVDPQYDVAGVYFVQQGVQFAAHGFQKAIRDAIVDG